MSAAERLSDQLRRHIAAAIVVIGAWIASAQCDGATGTFIDRDAANDLRVVSYNVFNSSIFENTNAVQAAKFRRVMSALEPDIVNLQEIAHSSAQVVSLFNSILPLGGSATWYAHTAVDNVIVSKYPLSLLRSNTNPSSPRQIAIALVDLPNTQFGTDFYFMNNHFKCCGNPGGSEDANRQLQADALVNWMRDARTPGGFVTLAANTPMAVVGDLNIVGLPDPLTNLISGNIVNESTYGPDSAPDWDGTSMGDAHPLHNASGPEDYTWRNDHEIFDPGRLDYVLYSDSVARTANRFVLNTVAMSETERAATGLETYDITLDTVGNYDHLPVVVDFRFVADGSPGDFNLDRAVDERDYDLWTETFGSGTNFDADGSGDQVVDAADYVVWRHFNHGAGGATPGEMSSVPEPTAGTLYVVACASFYLIYIRRR